MSFQAMAWAVGQMLPTREKFVLLMLANRTNSDTGRCDPSHKRIAEDCGMSVSSVKRAIQKLEDDGYLVVEARSKNGEKLPNQYRLCMEGVGPHRPIPPTDGVGVGSQGPEVGSHRPNHSSQRTEGVGSQGAIKQEIYKQEGKQEENQLPAGSAKPNTTGQIIPFEPVQPKVDIPADMPGPKDQECKTFKSWANYAFAYRKRYETWPVWNAKSAGQLSQLVDRLGQDVAHHVAAYYLTINDARLINDCHSLNSLLAKAEAIHTQWVTGRQMNSRTARQMEDTQANINAAQEAASLIKQGGNKNAFL